MAQSDFTNLVPTPGFLTDQAIRQALDAGYLIDRGSWQNSQVRHASYTIRLGSRVEVDQFSDTHGNARHRVSIHLVSGGDPLTLRPGDTAMLYCIEELRLPACVLAFTVARGLLFVESLVPENTYVDPGFSGPIYTTVTNLSGRILKIPYGTPLARLFFYRLPQDVAEPYRSGSAIGIDQHLESVPATAFRTPDDAKNATFSSLIGDLERNDIGGVRTAEILRRNGALSRIAVVAAVVLPLLLQVAQSWDWLTSQFGGFMSNVFASLVAAPLILGLKKIWDKLMAH